MTTAVSLPIASTSIPSAPWPTELRALGVGPDTLDAADREALDRDGFLLLPSHLPPSDLASLRAAHDRLIGEKYADAVATGPSPIGDYWHHERGTRRLTDLLSEGEVFERLGTDPRLLACVHRLMPVPFKHDSINAREPVPGQGGQGWHRDFPRPPDGWAFGVNSAWLLDPFTADNGATRVVPGSHRWIEGPARDVAGSPHPEERLIIAPAGSVLVFSGSLWHSGTPNRSASSRRVVHASFVRREHDLGARAQRLRIRKATWDRLSPAARWLIDV
jgi:hypothetical protein